jgi:hypothetical protein
MTTKRWPIPDTSTQHVTTLYLQPVRYTYGTAEHRKTHHTMLHRSTSVGAACTKPVRRAFAGVDSQHAEATHSKDRPRNQSKHDRSLRTSTHVQRTTRSSTRHSTHRNAGLATSSLTLQSHCPKQPVRKRAVKPVSCVALQPQCSKQPKYIHLIQPGSVHPCNLSAALQSHCPIQHRYVHPIQPGSFHPM